MRFENFVGVAPEAFSADFCQRAIDYYEVMERAGFAYARHLVDGVEKTVKDDRAVFCTSTTREALSVKAPIDLYNEFNDLFWNTYYQAYMEEYGILQTVKSQSAPTLKIQKTLVGGGYHVWHFEEGAREFARRMLAWMVFLNDVERGGETEFLYQHVRYEARAGNLLIWPAGFTHTHRGNPPLSGDKYVVTGWVEY